jgi:hypothetical protein
MQLVLRIAGDSNKWRAPIRCGQRGRHAQRKIEYGSLHYGFPIVMVGVPMLTEEFNPVARPGL